MPTKKKQSKLHDSLRRAIRSFFQTFLAVVIAQGGFTLTQTDLALLRSALIAGVASLIVFIHNSLEDQVPSIDTRE